MDKKSVADAPFRSAYDIISPCKTYRYYLEYEIGDGPLLLFVMLNPSTATRENLDPTMRRCLAFGRRWGYGRVAAVNPFALRASDPTELVRREKEAVGPDNDLYIAAAFDSADMRIVAWGAPSGAVGDMLRRRLRTLMHAEIIRPPMFCLGVTSDGQPKHPAARGTHRIPDDQEPIRWPAHRATGNEQ